MRTTTTKAKGILWAALGFLVSVAPVSQAAEPTLESSTFFGGTGDQRGTGVAIQGGNVYLSGVEGTGSELEALALSYANPPGPSPLWSTRWPNPTGTPAPADDQFTGVAATAEGLYFPGASYGQTTDGVGGKETKSILAKFPLAGATAPTWVAKPHFFSYTGVESFAGAVATTESGTPYIYVSGGGQPCSHFAYFIAKYDTAGNLIAKATDSSVGISFSSCFVPSVGGSSASAVTTLNGNVYAAGITGWSYEGDSPLAKASLWKYDNSLNLIWRRKNTTLTVGANYLGVTAVGSAIYAVGQTHGAAGSEQYVVDKYDEAGNLIWTKIFGGANTDILTGAIAVGNRVFVVGYTRSQGAGGADAVILEIDPATGDTLSTTLFGGQDDMAKAVATDEANLYIVGESRSFASAEGNVVGQNDVLLLRYALNVPFADFNPKVEMTLGPLANDDEFEVKATLTLGTSSDGIAPLTEAVTIQVESFSATIPAGSFKLKPATPKKPAQFKFEGIINGVALEAKITPLGGNSFEFKAEGSGVNLTGTVNPVTVTVTIGNDQGSTTVTAEFE